ncbi:MAG: response regulator [Thermoleophilia bacterium]
MSRRILIVEDDDDLRMMVGDLLREAGYSVVLAEDGLDGLRNVVDDAPDLILSDVLMPRMTGLELCALLKDSPQTRSIPFIFLTCVDDALNGFDVGADDYLTKPFRHRELLARVRAVFRRTDSVPPDMATAGLRGSLAELSLPEVLQTLHVGKASGCLAVLTADVESRVRLWLEQGELVSAHLDGPEEADGEAALFHASRWQDGIFSFDSTNRAELWTVQGTMEGLLLEAARALDEAVETRAVELDLAARQSCRIRLDVPSREELQILVDEVRKKLKLKAFEALVEGRPLHVSQGAPYGRRVDPGVVLPPDLDELIERMLGQE